MGKISYYMSSMILFNVFYIIKNFSLLDFSQSVCNYGIKEIFLFICIGVSSLFLVWGIIYTVIILANNYNPKSFENGKEYKFLNKQNITSTEFLGKFSLLVMTGLTIGSVPLWWGLSLYLLFFVAIAIIFIRCDMFYLNPIITLWGYEIYKCECNVGSKNTTVYFIVKDIDLHGMESIKSTYTNSKIIRLKGNKHERTNKTTNNPTK